MADAVKTAPSKEKKFIEIDLGATKERVIDGSNEHKYLTMEFEPLKRYVFELANKNPVRELPVINVRTRQPVDHQEFNPSRNLVFTSQIIWNGSRRVVRYYDGCETIFYDKQPKEKEIIDILNRQTQRRDFIYGKIAPQGFERMLLLYMNICSWNAHSPFRTPRANAVFIPVNSEDAAEIELIKLNEDEKALQYAKDASYQKMRIHAAYLGISLMDYDSGAELTEKELRVKYRRFAVDESQKFLESFGNKKIEIKYFIDKAIEKGKISNKFNANKATWGGSNTEICDISGLTSPDAISQRLFEFSQTEEGTDFLIQLKDISEDL